MLKALKASARLLRDGKPGSRFRELYDSRRSARRTPLRKVVMMIVGVGLVAIGVVELMIPGPGILIIALGSAILARESRAVARFLDRVEVRLRLWHGWAKGRWRRFRGWQKMAVVLLAAMLLVGGLAAGYRVVTSW